MWTDLNADVGECPTPDQVGQYTQLIPYVTSVSVACGFHAGGPSVMRATVELAGAFGVAIGAHPSYQDAEGFGRRPMRLPPQEIEDLVAYQVGALAAIAAARGVRLQHVKPHGALYNMAAVTPPIAAAIARAVAAVDPGLLLVGLQMAKQRYFQDALIDHVFQPRPIEILRPFHVVSPKTLYTMPVRSWDARLLDRAAARCAEIYGPYPEQNQPILLCKGGDARAGRLAKKFASLAPDFFSESFSVIDPHITPLKTCLHAIGRAPLVVAPNTGEAAILALAPSKKRIFYELDEAQSAAVKEPVNVKF